MKNSYLSQWVRAEIISAGVDMGAQVRAGSVFHARRAWDDTRRA